MFANRGRGRTPHRSLNLTPPTAIDHDRPRPTTTDRLLVTRREQARPPWWTHPMNTATPPELTLRTPQADPANDHRDHTCGRCARRTLRARLRRPAKAGGLRGAAPAGWPADRPAGRPRCTRSAPRPWAPRRGTKRRAARSARGPRPARPCP